MTILEEISAAIKEDAPATASDVSPFMRRVVRMDPKGIIPSLGTEAVNYLESCIAAIKRKRSCPVPPDFDKAPATTTEKVEKNKKSLTKKEKQELRDEAIAEEAKTDPTLVEDVRDLLDIDDMPLEIECHTHLTSRSIGYLVDQINKNEIRVPPIQRNLVWKQPLKEMYLTALFSNLPSQNIFLCIDPKTEHYAIIDGQQRLNTLREFLGDQIPFQGVYFSKLPENIKNRFRNRNIGVTEIKTDSAHWPSIFRYVNKGGVPLTDIEIRRISYTHPLVTALEEISLNHEEWIALFGTGNRFQGLNSLLKAYCFHTSYRDYQKPITAFMDTICGQLQEEVLEALKKGDSTLIDEHKDEMVSNFDIVLQAIWHGIGKDAFRLPGKKALNQGLIDALIHAGFVAIQYNHKVRPEQLQQALREVREKFVNDQTMVQFLTLDTSGREKVQSRMSFIEDLMHDWCTEKMHGIKKSGGV